jgi:hypothetical protein
VGVKTKQKAIEHYESSAVISDDKKHRYILSRQWGDSKKLIFVMLNPSTADANEDDPIIRRCIGFAKKFNYDGIIVLNLFSYRATNPKVLKEVSWLDLNTNDSYLYFDETINKQSDVVLAYGSNGNLYGQDLKAYRIIRELTKNIYCLELTKYGIPKHPLYLKSSCELQEFNYDNQRKH